MVRTVISLDPARKRWLDREARRRGIPMARLVREAVDRLARETTSDTRSFDDLLEATRGIWKRGDGLAWQRRMRGEWGRVR